MSDYTDRKDGKPKSGWGEKYKTLVREVNKVLNDYPDVTMTLRQVYYRLVARQIIPNTVNEYKYLSKLLVKAREKGEVDWRRIEDRLRSTIGGDHGYSDGVDFIEKKLKSFKDAAKGFSLIMWESQPKHVEVWVEKDALSRIISEQAGEYKVMTCPSRGFSSFTYIAKAVQRLRRAQKEGKEIVIIFMGDYDPSGMDIGRDLEERLIKYGVDQDHFEMKRVALNKEQITRYKLPHAMVKKSDSRAGAFVARHGDMAVELDALEPPVLQEIVKSAIIEEVDTDVWNYMKDNETHVKDTLKEAFKEMVVVTRNDGFKQSRLENQLPKEEESEDEL